MGVPAVLVLVPQGQDTSIRVRKEGGDPAPQTTGTQQPAGPQGGPQNPYEGCYAQLPMLLAIGLIFYFLLIRPQQKQEKARREMLSKLARGDRVVTTGGIHGVIATVADDTVQLQLDGEGRVRITVDRAAVGRVLTDEGAKSSAPAKEPGKS